MAEVPDRVILDGLETSWYAHTVLRKAVAER
jgi:hypothetical protein